MINALPAHSTLALHFDPDLLTGVILGIVDAIAAQPASDNPNTSRES